MAISQQQKVDFLLKKIGYTKTKTGNATDATGLNGSLTPKAGFAEAIPSPLIIADTSLWTESGLIPTTPPGSDTSQVKVYAPAGAVRMTVDSTVANNRAFIAYSTYNNTSSARLTNWIDTQFGNDYIIQVFYDDATNNAKKLSASGSGNNDGWFFDYSAGILNFNDTNVPTTVTSTNVYIVGYRYIGNTGAPTPGDNFRFTDLVVDRNLKVGGISTFTGLVDINGGGQANTFKVEDLTDNRIVIAGTGGELEDSGNLTFDGSTLSVTGILGLTGSQTISGDIDVDGHTNLDNLSVAGVSTFVGFSTFQDDVGIANSLTVSGISTFNNDVNFIGATPARSAFWDHSAHTLKFREDANIFLGDNDDFKIFNTGNNTMLRQDGNGALQLVGNDVDGIYLRASNQLLSESIVALPYREVSLYFNDVLKFSTSGVGVTVYNQLDTTNIVASGIVTITTLDVDGHTNLDNVSIAGFTTITQDLDVDGHTNLDNVSIVGVTTTAGLLNIDAGGQANTFKVEDLTSGRVVLAGTGGELEDSANLTFNGSNLTVGGNVNAVDGVFTGNVTIGGTLTYEDVTNVDAVGFVTARDGLIVVSGGASITAGGLNVTAGVSTFNGALDINNNVVIDGNVDLNGDIDVDGHTNLDNVSISGVTTTAGAVDINADLDVDGHTNLDNVSISGVTTTAGAVDINADLDVDGHTNLDNVSISGFTTITQDLDVDGHTNLDNVSIAGFTTITQDLDVDGHTNLDNVSIAGVTTTIGAVDINADLDVDGHTNLDNVSISGITTAAGAVDINADLDVDGHTNLDNVSIAGVTTTAGAVDINADLDVDGHTNLDNVSISGVTTAAGKIDANADVDVAGTLDVDGHTELDNVNVSGITTTKNFSVGTAGQTLVGIATILDEDNMASNRADALATQQSIKAYVDTQVTAQDLDFQGDSGTGSVDLDSQSLDIEGTTNEIETLASAQKIKIGLPNNVTISNQLTVTGAIDANGDLDVDGHTNLDNVSIAGVTTFAGAITANGSIDLNADIDVDGHTNLDNVSISGVTTTAGLLDINSGGQANTFKVEDLTSGRVVLAGTGGELEDSPNLTFDGSQLFVSGIAITATGLAHTSVLGVDIVTRNLKATGITTLQGIVNIESNLDVDGHAEFDNIRVAGIATFSGPITAGSSLGVNGQYMKRTATGVIWDSFPTLRNTQTFTATASQDTFNFSYNVGFLDVYHNGVKLTSSEFTASNGTNVVLGVGCFLGDIVELVSYNTVTTGGGGGGGTGSVVGINTLATSYFNHINAVGVITASKFYGDGSNLTGVIASGTGIIVKDSGSAVGTAGTIDFGSNLSVTAVSAGIVTVNSSGVIAGINTIGFSTFKDLLISGVSTFNGAANFNGNTVITNLNAGGNSYPTVSGSNGQVLTTNGSGSLTWTNKGSGGGSTGAGGTWATDTIGINTTKNVGIGTTAKAGYSLYVEGDQRVTGILTVGTASLTLDGINNEVTVGTSEDGVSLSTRGLETRNINATGISTFSDDVIVAVGATVGIGSTAYVHSVAFRGAGKANSINNASITNAGGSLAFIGSGVQNGVWSNQGLKIAGNGASTNSGPGANVHLHVTSSQSTKVLIQGAASSLLEFTSSGGGTNNTIASNKPVAFYRGDIGTYGTHYVQLAATSGSTFYQSVGIRTSYPSGTKTISMDALTGIITATQFKGDGSALTGVVASGSGIVVKDSGSTVGTAGTINFGTGLSLTTINAGIVTVTAGVTPSTSAPSSPAAGQLWWKSDEGRLKVYYEDSNTSQWVDATPLGADTTYDLTGSTNTTNQAIISLTPSSGTADTIELLGANGTSLTWDASNKRVTFDSVAPVNPDWDATSGISSIRNKPTIPSAYTLPTASGSTLGGIKVGANLSINGSGVLSANAGGYTLPMAAAGTLGGIKIGAGLSIDGNGVVTASGSASTPSIADVNGTTSSIADDASAELNITGHKAYTLFKVTVSKPSWVRIYCDDASRDADINRSESNDPTPGSGVIAEVRTTSDNQAVLITPGIQGFNNDNPRNANIYTSVTNRSGSATAVTVTLTVLQTGS